jgi:hypothetical protein
MRMTAICVAVLALSASAASSQEGTPLVSPERTPTAITRSAPVGHRQPKMTDLPPDVAQREVQPEVPMTNTPNQRNLDSRLTICRGC